MTSSGSTDGRFRVRQGSVAEVVEGPNVIADPCGGEGSLNASP